MGKGTGKGLGEDSAKERESCTERGVRSETGNRGDQHFTK